MLTELTYNDLEVTQGVAVCRMPNVNSKEGDPLKDGWVSPPKYRSGEAYPMVYIPICAIM